MAHMRSPVDEGVLYYGAGFFSSCKYSVICYCRELAANQWSTTREERHHRNDQPAVTKIWRDFAETFCDAAMRKGFRKESFSSKF